MSIMTEAREDGHSFVESIRVPIHEGRIVEKFESSDREFDLLVRTKIKLALKKGLERPLTFDYQDIRRNHFDIIVLPQFRQGILDEVTIVKKLNGRGSIESLLRENRTLSYFKKAIDKHAILMVINKQGKIVEVNERFLSVSGYKEEEVLLKPVKILNSGYHAKSFWQDLWKRVLKGDVFQEEIRNVGKLGNYFWLDTTIVPVFDEYERFQYFVSIAHDVTEIRNEFRKKLEKQFQLATLGKVAARFSHEINNPLTIINTIAGKMKFKGDNDAIRYDGQLIIDNIKRIESISESVRKASRKDLEISLGDVNLGDVFEHLLSIFSLKCKEEKVSLKFINRGTFIYGNYDFIIQILINLINNSFDSVQIVDARCIDVLIKEEEQYVEVHVKDNGPLVPDLIQKEIFQEFFTTKGMNSGTGIGLSLSKDMAQKMGGDLVLEQIGQDKSFILKLSKSTQGREDV